MKLNILAAFSTLILFCSSCFKKEDFTKINKVEITPVMALPLSVLDLDIEKIFKVNSTTSKVNSTTSINIDKLGNYVMNHLGIERQEQNIIDNNIPDIDKSFSETIANLTKGNKTFTYYLDNTIPRGINGTIHEIRFHSGSLEVNLSENTGGSDIKRKKFLIKSLFDPDGNHVELTTFISKRDLSGYKMILKDNRLKLGLEIESTRDISTAFNASLDIKLTNLSYSMIKGNIGKKKYDLGEATQLISIPKIVDKPGILDFTEAEVKLEIENGFNVPINLNISDMKSYRNSTSKKIAGPITNSNPLIKPAIYDNKTDLITPVTTSIIIDNNTSNLPELLDIRPTKIEETIQFIINEKEDPTEYVITKDAAIKFKLSYKIPLKPKLDEFEYNFIYDKKIIENPKDLIDKIEDLGLDITCENNMPFEFKMQIYYIDNSTGKETNLGKMLNKEILIQSSEVNEKGDVIKMKVSSDRVILNKESLNILNQHTGLLIKAKISTPQNKSVNLNIKNKLKLYLKVVSNIKSHIKTNI